MVLLPLSLFFPIHGSSQALGLDLVELNGQRHGKVAVSTALTLELFWPLFTPKGSQYLASIVIKSQRSHRRFPQTGFWPATALSSP
jgi:hypothetical protein